jgi:hypothetical protein
MNLFDKIRKEKYMVIDNFLSKEHIVEIKKEVVDNENLPLSFTADTISGFIKNKKIKNKNIVDSSQLVHTLYHHNRQIKSPYYDLMVGSILYKLLKFQTNFIVHRAKINLKLPTPKTNKDSFDGPHTDTGEPHLALILYLHDCDGDTFLLDEKNYSILNRISPKENRLLMFDGDITHAAGFPISSPYRYIINYNILPERNTND